MSLTVGVRTVLSLSVLLAACSQSQNEPDASVGGASGAAQGGKSSQPIIESSGGAATTIGAGGVRAIDGSGGTIAVAGAGGSTSLAGSGGGSSQPASSIVTPVTWKVVADSQEADVYINVPAAASRGKDAAVAYVERTVTSSATTKTRVVMQRFDGNGERIGALAVLANDPDENSTVTLASDGKQYAACWNVAPEVHCARVDEQNQVTLKALELVGQYATLVAAPNGWVLGYRGNDNRLRLQALTPTLTLNGSAIESQLFASSSAQQANPLLVSTPSGYALVASDSDGGELSLRRFASDLQPAGSAIPMGHNLWFAAQLVASDTRAAVSLSAPYGSYLLLFGPNELTAELPIAGGGKNGTDQGLLLTEGGLGAAWLAPNKAVRRRFFADGHDSDIGLENRLQSGGLLGLEQEGTDSYQQVLRVDGGLLLIARFTRYGAFTASIALNAAAIAFP